VSHTTLLRLVELVRRELNAEDARIEIGGRDPSEPRALWCPLPSGARLVVLFAAPPADRVSMQQRLQAFVEAFRGPLTNGSDPTPASGTMVQRALHHELRALVNRTGAVDAVVIDASSPVIWATSEAEHNPQEETVDRCLEMAEVRETVLAAGVDLAPLLDLDAGELARRLERCGCSPARSSSLCRDIQAARAQIRRSSVGGWQRYLLAARAVTAVRRADTAAAADRAIREVIHEDGFGSLVRGFAAIYRLILVFDRPFSELHAEAHLLRELPQIERLALSLPPFDPPPRGGRVLKLQRPE
jgi:hypothetical protein